jgi:hypothetical protein
MVGKAKNLGAPDTLLSARFERHARPGGMDFIDWPTSPGTSIECRTRRSNRPMLAAEEATVAKNSAFWVLFDADVKPRLNARTIRFISRSSHRSRCRTGSDQPMLVLGLARRLT